MRRAAVLLILAVAVLSLAIVGVSRSTRRTSAAGASQVASTAATPSTSVDPKGFTGTVAETMDSGGYTYAKLQAGKDEVWIAAREFKTTPGDRLTVALEMPMENFESKTLRRTFPLVYFVSGVTRDGQRVDGSEGSGNPNPAPMAGHAAAPVSTKVEPVAPPAGGLAIADVWAKRSSLVGKEVMVRGTVVKVNEQILGRNWIHLQDGSGAAAERTNDLTITTSDVPKVGDVVTIRGVLAVDKDFGAGYAYGAIIENAKLVK